MIYFIKNKYLTVSVNSDGGSMTSINYLGEERLWQGGEAWQSQDIVVFPVVGHAGEYEAEGKKYTPKSHGVARYSEFALADITEDKITLELNSNAVTKQTYPYDFDLLVTYALKKNTVKVTYTVRAKQGAIPFHIGAQAGMFAPDGQAVIEFESEENPVHYPLDGSAGTQISEMKRFVVNKEFFKECKTFQLGGIKSGAVTAHTQDGYKYVYKSDCPVYAFWSSEVGGDYICIDPWWGINDFPDSPKELKDKPFINFADENGKSFSYSLTIEKE